MTEFWEEARINEEESMTKLSNIQELKSAIDSVKYKMKEEESRKKKNCHVLGELLNKIQQLHFLKQTESLETYNIDPAEQQRVNLRLNNRQRELKTLKSVVSSIKKKYELSLLQSDSVNPITHIQSSEDVTKENSRLKLKIRELKITNTAQMKEIEHSENPVFYPNIITSLQNELKQLVFKKNEYTMKHTKSEKSIQILKRLFTSIVNESYNDLSNNFKGKEFIKENKIDELREQFDEEVLNYDTLGKLFLTDAKQNGKHSSNNNNLLVYEEEELPVYGGVLDTARNKSQGKYTAKPGNKRSNLLPPLERKSKSPIGVMSNKLRAINSHSNNIQIQYHTNNDSSARAKKNHTALSGLKPVKERISVLNNNINNHNSKHPLYRGSHLNNINSGSSAANVMSPRLYNNAGSIKYQEEAELDRQELIQLEFEDCDNERFDGVVGRLESLKQFLSHIQKNIILQEKQNKKRMKEAQKTKSDKIERLEGIKEENDLAKTEIDYLSFQLVELAKRNNIENLIHKENNKYQMALNNIRKQEESRKKGEEGNEEGAEEGKEEDTKGGIKYKGKRPANNAYQKYMRSNNIKNNKNSNNNNDDDPSVNQGSDSLINNFNNELSNIKADEDRQNFIDNDQDIEDSSKVSKDQEDNGERSDINNGFEIERIQTEETRPRNNSNKKSNLGGEASRNSHQKRILQIETQRTKEKEDTLNIENLEINKEFAIINYGKSEELDNINHSKIEKIEDVESQTRINDTNYVDEGLDSNEKKGKEGEEEEEREDKQEQEHGQEQEQEISNNEEDQEIENTEEENKEGKETGEEPKSDEQLNNKKDSLEEEESMNKVEGEEGLVTNIHNKDVENLTDNEENKEDSREKVDERIDVESSNAENTNQAIEPKITEQYDNNKAPNIIKESDNQERNYNNDSLEKEVKDISQEDKDKNTYLQAIELNRTGSKKLSTIEKLTKAKQNYNSKSKQKKNEAKSKSKIKSK